MSKTIKFRVKNQDDPFFTELRQSVGAYLATQHNGRYANGLILLKAAMFLSMYWGAYCWILVGNLSVAAVVGLYASLGISGLFVAFNISHDAAHGSLTRYPFLNKVVYYLTFDPLGTDAYLWKMRREE